MWLGPEFGVTLTEARGLPFAISIAATALFSSPLRPRGAEQTRDSALVASVSFARHVSWLVRRCVCGRTRQARLTHESHRYQSAVWGETWELATSTRSSR